MNRNAIQALAKAVIETQAGAITGLLQRIDDDFIEACTYLLECSGRVVVIGMGKSGHIGSKIAATMASTGTPAFFVHPAEASHGDLGMIKSRDVVLAGQTRGHLDKTAREPEGERPDRVLSAPGEQILEPRCENHSLGGGLY